MRNLIFLVFFYDEDDEGVEEVLGELETVDDNLEAQAVEFVRCSDSDALEEYGLQVMPSLVHFEHGIPTVYSGDLKNDDNILGWITKELESAAIVHVRPRILDSLLERLEFVAVFYYRPDDSDGEEGIKNLMSIKEEANMNDIYFVLVSDQKEHAKLGVEDSPVLVYYENNIPFLYKNPLRNEEKLLAWLIEQRNQASIEEITDEMLSEVLEENEFVAVVFLGLCREDEDDADDVGLCDRVMTGLETIDGLLDEHGIVMVMTTELDRARELWISKFPAIVFFRNGEDMKYRGDIASPKAVYNWLTSEKTLNVANKIVEVNGMMLTKLLRKKRHSTGLFVFFYESGNIFSEKIIRQLEDVEDQLTDDPNLLDFVKIGEPEIGDEYGLEDLPALVFFGHDEELFFFGDLRQRDRIAEWIFNVRTRGQNSGKKRGKKG